MDPTPHVPPPPENPRKAAHGAAALFTERWSPRAFSPEPLAREEVLRMFEAARWSPSCFNEQPWLFVWADDRKGRERILGTLGERNRAWARNAPLLAVLFARRRFEDDGKPNRWAAFDCGAAWMALALQARLSGLYTHAMGGFDAAGAHRALGVPEQDYEAMCVIAAGRRGDPADLPAEMRERERPGLERRPLESTARRFADGG